MSDQRAWIAGSVGEGAFEKLASGLPGSTLQSVLLEVVRARAQARTPAAVLEQYERDGFCRPAAVDPRTSLAIDAELFAAAAAFEAIELSPMAPLGACSALAPTDQNRVLSALRATEVVTDPTNVLALECALRLRAQPATAVHLATSQRVIRAQALPKVRGFAPHFRIFVLASGGPETRGHAFTVESLVRHLGTMLDALDRLERLGYAFGARRVDVLATPERAALADRVADAFGPLAARKPLAHAYYSGGLRWMLWTTTADGEQFPLADGGAFDWLAKLTSNRRAVYVASGIGSQLVGVRFRR